MVQSARGTAYGASGVGDSGIGLVRRARMILPWPLVKTLLFLAIAGPALVLADHSPDRASTTVVVTIRGPRRRK